MKRIALGTLLIIAALIVAACSGGHGEGESREGPGEHGGAAHDQSGENGSRQEGEESATQYDKSETYDRVRGGARLILSYDAASNAFTGTVENTTDAVLDSVRIEVHLSNGIELGPTEPGDLAPGEQRTITLPASEEAFSSWNAHPEVGREEANHVSDRQDAGESSEGGEGSGEHGGGESREGAGEHGDGGDSD